MDNSQIYYCVVCDGAIFSVGIDPMNVISDAIYCSIGLGSNYHYDKKYKKIVYMDFDELGEDIIVNRGELSDLKPYRCNFDIYCEPMLGYERKFSIINGVLSVINDD